MIDLNRLAELINKRGLMNKSFRNMSRDDVFYLCKAVISSQEPGYWTDHETLVPCMKHDFWYVYKDNCEKCDKKEACPVWPTDRQK